MDFRQEMEVFLRSRFTVIWVVSYEEERVIAALKVLCAEAKPERRLLSWDVAAGLKVLHGGGTPPAAGDPRTALEAIAKADAGQHAVFVLKDLGAAAEGTLASLGGRAPVTFLLRAVMRAKTGDVRRKVAVASSPFVRAPGVAA